MSLCDYCRDGKYFELSIIIDTLSIPQLNIGLFYACRRGHKNIVELLLNKGANDFDSGLVNACYSGNREIIDLMLSKGADDFNDGLSYACEGGHIDVVKLMIDKGATDFTRGLSWSNRFKFIDISLLMLEKGADINTNDYILTFTLNDIYYLLLRGIKEFGKFNNIALECKKHLLEFSNTVNEFFIKDIANIIIEY